MNYKITVIIPTYNTGHFLTEALDSIKSQTIGFENIEVILVDDKSTDENTINLIKEYDSNYSNCKTIFLENNSGFPGKPRNIGIKNSTSDYVIVMDHDDYYNDEAFEILYNKISDENADMVLSTYIKVYDDKLVKPVSVFGENVDEVKINTIDDELKFFEIAPSIWCKLFRKDFLFKNNISFIEGMLAEDLHFFVNALIHGKGIIYLNNFYGYNYRIRNTSHDKSTIHIRNQKYLHAMIEGYYKIWDILKSNGKEEYFSNVFKNNLVYWLISFIYSDISFNEKKELIKEINPILKKQLNYTPNFNERIFTPLVEPILNDDYNNIVKASKKIKLSLKVKEGIKSFIKKFK